MTHDIPVDHPVSELQSLFEHFNISHPGVAETCRILAKHLNRQVFPRKRWGWQYVHQVFRHQIQPSKLLQIAISRLYQKILSEPQPKLHSVSVLAPIGFVPPRTIVTFRARACALETCQQSFLPANPNQIYHSPSCRRWVRKQRKRQSRHQPPTDDQNELAGEYTISTVRNSFGETQARRPYSNINYLSINSSKEQKMSRFNYELTESKIADRLEEGRGEGTGSDYKPWLTYVDFPSQGRKARPKGIKSDRVYQLFSKNEELCSYILDLSERVLDIREQYPLLPREETEVIARALKVKHPRDTSTKVNAVLTSDFRLTILKEGKKVEVVRTVKELADLNNLRTLEKLEIEHMYYKSQNIDWGIIIAERIPKDLAMNCLYFREYFSLEKLQIDQQVLDDIYTYLTPLVQKKEAALRILGKNYCDKQLNLREGTSVKAALHFIATRQWSIDWHQRFSTGQVIHLISNRTF